LDGKTPQTFEELWAGYDPRSEPLEVEVIKEWEEDGVFLQILRYRIGVFKGQKAMMAAVYGHPKGGRNLPGLLQIHGGGQYADYRAVVTNAKRGYATISIAWAGRISAPGYTVNEEIVKLFWDGRSKDPAYKLTTDWGPLDAYHAPCRNAQNAFAKVTPASWTLDSVESPRNNSWFLCVLGARRALTFLEQQSQVDPERLGVYGHSMGGKLTVMTAAADGRIKAAAPSCGGVSDRDSDNAIYQAAIGDDAYLKHIACPIIFLSPSNDFHGHMDDLQKAIREIPSKEWRVTCSPHHNHQDTAEYQVAGLLWFDQYLKKAFTFPQTPKSSLDLITKSRIPVFTVKPDASRPILSVDIYYTQQGYAEGEKENMQHTINRFWHHAAAVQKGNTWTAALPLLNTDKPLWVYANVLYPLDKPVTGAGYYYAVYTAETVNLSSTMHVATADELKAAAIKTTMKSSLVIETFQDGWQKEWFTYDLAENWARRTHKLYNEKWQAPLHAKLALEVSSEQPNKMVIGLDSYAAEISLAGDSQWRQIILSPQDFRNAAGGELKDWSGIRELRLSPQETLREKVDEKNVALQLGADWQGPKPQFRKLEWIKDIEVDQAGVAK
jgi:pimeloyl-ACP methyl ester carboxylesterase